MNKNNMIIICDGVGIGKCDDSNAFYLAKTPTFDYLFENYPTTKIQASGEDVGLPKGQMGNSEVGHLNLGAGRIIYQNLLKIQRDIDDGRFFQNEELKSAIESSAQNKKALHLIGLLSDGGVHSHENHLYALLQMAYDLGEDEIYVHIITDGRDVSPVSGEKFVANLEKRLKELGRGKIATISGRYYAMDRDNNYDRIEKAYNAIVMGKGDYVESIDNFIKDSYEADVTDEFLYPTVAAGYKGIEDGDSVIFYNFRPDRARQLTRAISEKEFNGFEREKVVDVNFVTMTVYDSDLQNVKVAYTNKAPEMTMGEYLSKKGLNQLRIAETEKFAHVTYFFNGGIEEKFEGEDRILIPSPKVATFDLKPEMSANEITDKVLEAIDSEKYDFILLNFANGDMVGHTGVMEAAIKAVETVDSNLKRILDKIKEVGGNCLITADHGNCDYMHDEEGNVITAHSTNPVMLVLYNYTKGYSLKSGGRLCDVSPTMLEMMGLSKPLEMEGESLLIKN